MQLILLSHPIDPTGPVYPGDPPPVIESRASAAAGDDYTAFVLHISNHAATHVDGPAHFNPAGPPLADLPTDSFVFVSPLLIDIPRGDDELISAADLQAAVPMGAEPDMLMIRTGFERWRASDAARYAARPPGLSADAARWLMSTLPGLRAIALDTISAGAPAHTADAFEAHRILCGFGRDDGRFVLIYEDVSLGRVATSPVRVWGLPLLARGIDSAPITMIAEV